MKRKGKGVHASKRPKDTQRRGTRGRAKPITLSKPPVEAAPWHYSKPLIGPLVEDHSDERGRFVTVENAKSFQHPIGAVAVLTRKKGSVFAEHRHADEGHTCMLVTGQAEYHERNATGRVLPIRMLPFVPLFTPPDVDHAFLAIEDCIVVVIANIARTQSSYEADVKRLVGDDKLVSPERIAAALGPPTAAVEGAPV